MPPDISVVVPTRDRPSLLARCLDRVLAQKTERAYEIVVVNDGAPLPPLGVLDDPRVVVITTSGRGPAATRNRGVAVSRGSLILFTDDDALPELGWLESAATALEQAPNAVGAEGPTDGRDFDPLFEHSIHNDAPGAYFTCNVAYRRDDFLAVGGFDLGFPSPHCEDVDLGRRITSRGPILFVPSMRVVHPPRPIGFFELALRARMIESEWRLHHKHPETRPLGRPVRWGPLIGIARRWHRRLLDPAVRRGSVLRAGRVVALGLAQLAVGFYTTLTRWQGQQ